MRRRSGTQRIDDTDRRLCALLARDPRMSNRLLATAVQLTDETVAARLRRLRDSAVLETTVVVDSRKAGYDVEAVVRINVSGRPFREVVAGLAEHPCALAITETSGACDGVVTAIARDLRELRDFVTESIRTLAGISAVSVDLIIDDLKIPEAIVTLPIPGWEPDDLPAPRVAIDEVDKNLIRELIRDGHRSNTEIARRLDVSDATVRRRVQRLEDSGLIRVVAAVDPVATGDVSAVAFAFLDTAGPSGPMRAALDGIPEVLTGYATIGSADTVLLIGSSSDNALTAMASQEISALPGVHRAQMAFGNEVLHHRGHLTRLAPVGEDRDVGRGNSDVGQGNRVFS